MSRPGWLGSAGALLVGLGLGFGLGVQTARAGAYDGLDQLARVFSDIADHYVQPVRQEELVWRAMSGLAGSLDPFSAFYPPDLAAQTQEEHIGVFVGAGLVVEGAPCGLRVTGVLPDAPAARAGVVVGDCLVSVGGEPVLSLGVELATARLGQGEGSVLVVEAENQGERRRVVMALVRVEPRWLVIENLGKGWWYVGLREVRAGAAERVRAALGRGVVGVVLDLRGNPGGVLEEAVGLADLFLTDGEIVSSTGRGAGQTRRYPATASQELTGELRVLIDGGSASAAEVLAGVLQARKRARLYGSPSYGKGLVQTFFHYEDGSVLKLTTGRYELPDGRRIDPAHPLVPDVLVEEPELPELAPVPPPMGWSSPELAAPARPVRAPWPSTPVREQAKTDPVLAASLPK